MLMKSAVSEDVSNDDSDMMEEGPGDSEDIGYASEHASTKKTRKGSLDISYLKCLYPGVAPGPEELKCLHNIALSA
jgi:hypothetical protein